MIWQQIYDPLGNMWLSALVAALPILLFFISLVVFKMKGWLAAFLTVLLSLLISIFVYKMPFSMAIMSFIQGFLTGLWPIAWIIIAAIFLYKLSVKSGYFEILKHSVMTVTPDQRIQVILVGFCFGAFLEGAIGFGAPVAITAALLVGLGLRPLYAAGLCMVANTAPVAFGAVGIPIIALAGLVGIPAHDIAAMTGRMLPPITMIIPFFIVFIMDGYKGVRETFPAIFIAAISFALVQFFSSNFLGPELPDILSAVVSLVATSLFLKKWQPKHIYRAEEETKEFDPAKNPTFKQIFLAWLPFIFLIIVVVIWSIPVTKAMFAPGGALDFTTLTFKIPLLHDMIVATTPIVSEETPLKAVYKLDLLHAAGTAILVAAILSIIFIRFKISVIKDSAAEAFSEMKIPILTIGLVLAFAFIAKSSGQAATLGLTLAQTGEMATFFSPVIGWIGVFLTGSDTSSNLLFGTLQQVTANQLGIPELLFLAANSVGGVVGKMISPQSIAVACAAVGMVGRESELFRWTVKYSTMLILIVALWTLFIANFIPFIIPS